MWGSAEGGVAVYDINTGEEAIFFQNCGVSDCWAESGFVFSPDNTRVVVYTVEDRLPIYRHAGPEATIWSVRFADWGVIETTSAEGVQRWDLHTGEYLP